MDNKKVDDIVAMLDNFMANGGGHMNIEVGQDGDIETKQVTTNNSNECLNGDMACKVPTLHRGLDDDE